MPTLLQGGRRGSGQPILESIDPPRRRGEEGRSLLVIEAKGYCQGLQGEAALEAATGTTPGPFIGRTAHNSGGPVSTGPARYNYERTNPRNSFTTPRGRPKRHEWHRSPPSAARGWAGEQHRPRRSDGPPEWQTPSH